jgi:hypothetical protein
LADGRSNGLKAGASKQRFSDKDQAPHNKCFDIARANR